MTTKTLTVATEVQKKVFEEILLPNIQKGFWKNSRPADHADLWIGITIVIGSSLGPNFDAPRRYNFVNPDFFHKEEANLLRVAQEIDPEINIKKLKKQLISLNQIVDGRLKEIGGEVQKLARGKKAAESITSGETVVRKVQANIVDEEQGEDESEVA